MKNKKGFTIIELLIGLAIGVILLLMMGAISHIGQTSFENSKKEAQIYKDAIYGLEFIKLAVHKAGAVNVEDWPSSQWKSRVLVVDNSAFGLYEKQQGQGIDFVYLKDKSKTNEQDIILAAADPLILTFNQNNKLVSIQLQGTKDKESFDLTAKATMRN